MNDARRSCPDDGTPIEPGYRFCPRCGREAAVPAPVDVPAEPFRIAATWERARYPEGVDSMVRAVLALESTPDLPIERLRTESHLVLVLDVSGSMNVPEKYPLLREALDLLMSHLEEGLYLTVVLFSTESQILCQGVAAPEVRRRRSALLARMDESPIRFQETHLRGGLDLAVDAVREFRAKRKDVVPRLYVLTDGQLTDPERAYAARPELERLGAEVHSFGFGRDFAFESMRRIMGTSPGGTVKHIRDTQDVLERFQRVAQVTASIVATEVVLQMEFAEGVIPGDVFSHRPAQRLWPASEFRPPRAPRFEIGVLEAERRYAWAFEARLPEDPRPGFRLGKIRLAYRQGGRDHELAEWLEVPVAAGAEEGAADPAVASVFTSLEDLRDDRIETQIAAYEARIEICRAERRDPEYLRALEEVVSRLRAGIAKEAIDESLLRAADADPSTCTIDHWGE
ncbi:MAG: VWA domain-containing protein [Planctomycetes bacterium]|nr:VWA domain-containing protein [Planctomycetota bacterium]